MKFVENDIITIDQEDYYVASIVPKDGKNYAYIIKATEDEELTEEFDVLLINDDNTLSEVVDNKIFAAICHEVAGEF